MADEEAVSVRDRRALTLTLIVVSGAPGTGKSTIARALGADLRFPVLSLDPVKEALADVLGLGDEDWSNRVGEAVMVLKHTAGRAGPSATAAGPAPRRPWSVLVLLCVAQFMVILDMTVVNIALPSIGRTLRFAPSDLQWVITTYLLTTGGLTLLGGRAADLFGRRRMFVTGLALFTAASLASGLAPVAGALIASRAAQGLGAALLTPAALAIITATYTGAQRAAALSAWGALAGGGMAVGVLAGGVLTTWFGWRSVFLINVPVGLAAGWPPGSWCRGRPGWCGGRCSR